MLTPEAKAALMARLSESTQEAEAPVEMGTPEQTPAPVVETSLVHDAPVSPEPIVPPVTEQPKLVPLDDLVKVRQARNTAREELAREREARARLEGELSALKQASKRDSWVDEALAPDPEDVDPNADLRATVEEIQAERRQDLLNKVVNLVKEADPTLPQDYLIEQLASGKTPQQVVQRWQGLREAFIQSSAPPQVVAPPTPAPPKAAPPTVQRATVVQGAPKPTAWGDVSKAVRALK